MTILMVDVVEKTNEFDTRQSIILDKKNKLVSNHSINIDNLIQLAKHKNLRNIVRRLKI